MPKINKGLDYWEGQIAMLDSDRVGERLEALREAMGIPTKAEMARLIGVSSTHYGNWLPGTKEDGTPKKATRLNLHYAAQIATTCGVTIDYIALEDLSGIDEPLQSEIKARLRAIRKSNAPKRRS